MNYADDDAILTGDRRRWQREADAALGRALRKAFPGVTVETVQGLVDAINAALCSDNEWWKTCDNAITRLLGKEEE